MNAPTSADDLEHRFQRARALHQSGDCTAAAEAYRAVVAAAPQHFRAWTNLGDCLDRLGDNAAAEAAFAKACEAAPNEARPRYNLARQLHLRGELAAAEASYRRAIELDARLVEAYLNLGRLLEESGRLQEARKAAQTAADAEPDSAAAQLLLGHLLFGQERPLEALAAYRRAAELAPGGETHFHVGKTLQAMRRAAEATEWHRRALELEPRSTAAREALARSLLSAGHRDAAIASLQAWLEVMPENATAAHMLAALGAAAAPPRASDAYVRATFDSFADSFDRTLARLDYRAPQLVAAAIARHLAPHGALDVLDAGCGTGLCGPLLKPYARILVGVDLSSQMLVYARRRADYDELVEAELTAFLVERSASFDLIACADTLCYFGELDGALGAAAQSLRPGGLLVFTLERLDDPAADSRLLGHGRYAHAATYVERVLHARGFDVLTIDSERLRNEGDSPVAGWVVAARRALH